MERIINSILDNDFYKITMQFAVTKLYPDVQAKYTFINRGKHEFPEGFGEELKRQVVAMAELGLTKEEKQYLHRNCPYISPSYLDFLQGYRYDPDEVEIVQEGSDLQVHVKGYWYRTILWEVPLLALISELYYRLNHLSRVSDQEITEKTSNKIDLFNKLGVTVADFGTRRRHSYQVHDLVIQELINHSGRSFVGSSNVHFAHKYNVKPIGTHAHEWFMFHGARFGYKIANSISLDRWVKVFYGDLGIALTDTYTSAIFFRQFDKKLSKLFDGVRHDSGDPIEFAQMTIDHYQKMGINPLHKTIIFSDGLNPEKVENITKFCKNKIGISFGIGTNLTNDTGLRPMNIVMKLTGISSYDIPWTGVVKLSDEGNKHTGNVRDIELAKEILQLGDIASHDEYLQ
ncbi:MULTISPECIES: nicotinate phosphoribosyltransferase [Weeksella]|uniref:Nicotinate phosphoribosyltransferase n=1 Tax=Weeksella virosa (strain ATCC 43766 / DSM 16922 / JCM 21250 / CCUG 30538 / CDC 9751 / IAM 14551 / NBRC 16016 / NCTC 11634 / CL345/78) TaxID=865938 RepID=F0NZY0_WEEVC|nr:MULTISPECIES: nicotinate phosphoribosyltransferase [Weeksella]ADX68404.1 Nicotinate phosphoribosyltransferase [Weeksella virosa DSM 16922]MDK7375541.1 nicotinate phosphoribosyltransferase [Weeksella virosa]MDK7674630.1 nicotinate phosphoribosyltransferase [Weeksella virosa]OFM84324.1 nicotinate phosphoribosyltransferase [Weeksella sp. HMSC059D05]SUP54736.1 Nicotinate phosphoribosyltransferase 2 [Weeksella virosa]